MQKKNAGQKWWIIEQESSRQYIDAWVEMADEKGSAIKKNLAKATHRMKRRSD